MLEFCRQSLDLKEVLERPLPLQVVDVVRGAGDRLVSVVVCESQLVSVLTMEQLTAADLELTGLSVQRIVVKVHRSDEFHLQVSSLFLVLRQILLEGEQFCHLKPHCFAFDWTCSLTVFYMQSIMFEY